MKIKTKKLTYEQVISKPRPTHLKPVRPSILMRTLMRLAGEADLRQTNFTYTERNMDGVLDEPCLILMNHSSFIDLEIVAKILFPKPYCIVCTSDGFVGKAQFMRQLGCIPTQKFVNDVELISDIQYALKELKCHVLMYPEASYSFDGCATPLPRKLGVLLKRLDVPVVSIHTDGAFLRDPLYNCLQKRNTRVSAEMSLLLSREDIKQLPSRELDKALDEAFTFDNFAKQLEDKVEIVEAFRADGLNRILFRCASCGREGAMRGEKTSLHCDSCGKKYTLDTLGRLIADEGEAVFSHIPDWYAWEREEVRKEIENDSYCLDVEVDIGMMVDFEAIYMVGSGVLHHDRNGFRLTGCDGRLEYVQSPSASYGLYADYYWYELGDIICIGNKDALYYCFPKGGDVVAKTRIAVEELYKLQRKSRVASLR